MRKAQAGIEYIITVGILLIFLIPTIHYALNEATLQIRVNQLQNAMQRITKAADAAFALGPGTTEVITITIPTGITDHQVQNNYIRYKISMYGTESWTSLFTAARLGGTLPTQPGTYQITLLTLENGTVTIQQDLA